MKKVLSCIFTLLIVGGVGILAVGVLMHWSKTGTDTGFYKFFNDNVFGWIIIFGSIIVGIVGRIFTGPIFDYDHSGYIPSGSGDSSTDGNYKNFSDNYSDYSSNDSDERFVNQFPYEYDKETGYSRSDYRNDGNWTDAAGNQYEQKTDCWGSVYYEKIDDDGDE